MIKIKFFALLKESTRLKEMSLEASPGLSCEGILASLRERFPHLSPLLSTCLLAVNGSYAVKETVLSEGDELALIPPVSGG